MRTILFAAIAALTVVPTKVNAQTDSAHARAWDAHQRGATSKVRTTRTSARRTTQRQARRSIPARYSPAIAREPVVRAVNEVGATILPHPSGCPRRAFCGCGAAVEVFGSPRRDLWLAAAWLRFPAAQPGPGMVAARRGHVMVIRQYLGNGKALVYDANSGRGQTRLHVRSLAGFSIRNPRA